MSRERAYGLHAVEELLRSRPEVVTRLLVAKGREDRRLSRVLALADAGGVPVEPVARKVLDGLVSGRHQGAVAELEGNSGSGDLRWSEAQLIEAVSGRRDALVLVLDGVTDPHNLGACLRSADAAGVDAVVTPKDNAADITPVVRKVACGATETVPLVRVTNLARALDGLKEAGLWLYGAAGEAEASLYQSDLSGPVALVMGAEGKGLRRLTREHCDVLVKLPMAGVVSSLNVSVATGVCLFEIVRQRGAGLGEGR
jgi:23S rRNA (guanosine2251-2'-O)-methyltransferase